MAFDLDGTVNNNELSYAIKSITPSVYANDESMFQLRKIADSMEIGLFKMAGTDLDRDNLAIGSLIKIDVLVSDNGGPKKLTAKKQIKISLNDLNDNPPRILNTEQLKQVNVFEDQELGKPVILIKVINKIEKLLLNIYKSSLFL